MRVVPQVKQYTGYVSTHPHCSLSYRALRVIILYRINIIRLFTLNPNIVLSLTFVSQVNLPTYEVWRMLIDPNLVVTIFTEMLTNVSRCQ